MNLSAFNDYILFIVGMEPFIYERDDESKGTRVEQECVHLNQMIRLLFESHMCDSVFVLLFKAEEKSRSKSADWCVDIGVGIECENNGL